MSNNNASIYTIKSPIKSICHLATNKAIKFVMEEAFTFIIFSKPANTENTQAHLGQYFPKHVEGFMKNQRLKFYISA